MRVIAASDWIIDIGPGAGSKGGKVVAYGTPREVSRSLSSRTATFLTKFLG
jgi:excinuclease ABC subunit A